jgi:hypothetical protein
MILNTAYDVSLNELTPGTGMDFSEKIAWYAAKEARLAHYKADPPTYTEDALSEWRGRLLSTDSNWQRLMLMQIVPQELFDEAVEIALEPYLSMGNLDFYAGNLHAYIKMRTDELSEMQWSHFWELYCAPLQAKALQGFEWLA